MFSKKKMDMAKDTVIQLERYGGPTKSMAGRIVGSACILVRSLQCLGLCPLSVSFQHKRLDLKFWSWTFVLSCAVLVLLFGHQVGALVAFFRDPFFFTDTYAKRKTTKRLSFAIMHVTCTIVIITSRAIVFAKARGSARFWNESIRKLEAFQVVCLSIHGNIEGAFTQAFTRIKFEINRVLLFGICFLVVFEASYDGYLYDFEFHFEFFDGLLWDLSNGFQFVYVVYVTFFLKIYSNCTSILSKELSLLRATDTICISGNHWMSCKKKMISWDQEHSIRQCLDAYEILEELVSDFNEEFSLPIIFHLFMYVVLMTIVIFFDIDFVETRMYVLVCWYTCWAISLVWQTTYLAWEASCVTLEAQRFKRALGQIDVERIQGTLKDKVLEVIRRIDAEPPAVHPGHFFTLNRRLLPTILTTVTMYLIILIQFRATDSGKGADDPSRNGTIDPFSEL